jgi:hypothetical protein
MNREDRTMTEYEITEVLYSQYDTLWEASQMYFTLVSAYLIVAYLVGEKLNLSQHFIVTALYVVWAAGLIQTQVTTGLGALRVAGIIESQREYLLGAAGDNLALRLGIFSFTVVMILGLAASLYFMWSIRRPKAE